jgi:hypothetical protein
MKKLSITILLSLLLSNLVYPQTDSSRISIKDLAIMEFQKLKNTYANCIKKPSECYGDSLFFKTWLDGLEYELNSNLVKASEYYNKALLIRRYELSSYEVGYSLGRVELLKGNTKLGISILNKYLKDAIKDLNDENAMWGLTDDAKKEIKQKTGSTNQLIKVNQKN